MKYFILLFTVLTLSLSGNGQIRIKVLNPEVDSILHGIYDPSAYAASNIINSSDDLLQGIFAEVSKDSVRSYLERLDDFHNRNTGSDTLSETQGIGAARRWLHSKYASFGAANENRLRVSFMQFKVIVCGMLHHKNVMAVLPGADTTNNEVVIIQAHFDSRCEDACDTECFAPGVDDNGSGTALVLELARVMSKYTFDRTIVFASLTGEEQGLYGAKALATYFNQENIPVKAVLNNDIVGGVTCGNTSSSPPCPYHGHVDSMNVRVFSNSYANDSSSVSPHKQLARFIKMQQEEKLNPLLQTPLNIRVELMKDRGGRSGDHIPFSDKGFTAVRFTSANEHGNGSGTAPDRQHSARDLLGVDTTADGVIDSFYVDLNYLRRNILINGVAASFLAAGPNAPNPVYTDLNTGVQIDIQGEDTIFDAFKVGVRKQGSGSLYFDTVYHFSNTQKFAIFGLDAYSKYYFSVAAIKDGFESIFADEYAVETTVGISESRIVPGISMSQNYPNPSKGETEIIVQVNQLGLDAVDARIVVYDVTGQLVVSKKIDLHQGEQKIVLNEDKKLKGLYLYAIVLNNQTIQTRRMLLY